MTIDVVAPVLLARHASEAAIAALHPTARGSILELGPGQRFVFQAGPAERRPIVLLHPFGVDWRVWLPVMSHLWDRFRVVAVDLPGHGVAESDTLLGSIGDAAALVAGLIERLGGTAPALVGASMGGAVAQHVALTRAERLRSLVLVATFVRGGEAQRERATLALRDGTAGQIQPTIERWFGAGWQTVDAACVDYARNLLGAMTTARWAAAWRAMAEVDNEAGLRGLGLPVLSIAGGADVSTPQATMRQFSSQIPNCRFEVIEDAPHMVILTHPAQIAARIADFVKD